MSRFLAQLKARVPLLLVAVALFLTAGSLFGEQRFPPPDFETTGHKLPPTAVPPARAGFLDYLDIAVLALALGFSAWLMLKKRSRKWVIGLSLFSLGYFGFYREGCICAIGSVQNLALGLFDRGYAVPLVASAFFVLPIVFALFFGRAFCAGVCPHGALQDLVLLKPAKVPGWLEQALSVLPYIYLGAGVLFAATGSAFIICQYDPFVPVFRLNGRTLMVVTGAGLLLLGVFVGRPYCRFLCPLGALLKLGGIVSKWRPRVTPNSCTQCRLCEATCPFGAMRRPETPAADARVLRRDRLRLTVLLAILPLLVGGGVLLGRQFSGAASLVHPQVRLAERFVREKDRPSKTGVLSPDDLALERARQAPAELLTEAARIRGRFHIGSMIFGGWVGLVIGLKLVSLSLRRQRTDYEPDRGDCVGCARCFEFCPNELVRRGVLAADAVPASPGAAVRAVAGSDPVLKA